MKPRNILRCRLLVFGIPWIKRDYDARRGEGVISNRVNVVFVGIRFGNVFLWYDVKYDAPRDLRLRDVPAGCFTGFVSGRYGLGSRAAGHRHRREGDARHRDGLAEGAAFRQFAFEVAHLRLAVGARARAVARVGAFALLQRDAVGVGDLPPHLFQHFACGFSSGHR